MPELPEVETVRRGLAPVMEGKRIRKAEARRPDLRWPLPEHFAERLTGRKVQHLGRRSKYILAALDGDETLLIHLGMSGRMLISGGPLGQFHYDDPKEQKHDHVVLKMEDGETVTFNDARRFGAMDLVPTDKVEDHWLLKNLGPEPLGNRFDADYLAGRLKGRKSSIKAALMDQRIVAGLGNIYVCEALFAAGINPKTAAGRIAKPRIEKLVTAIREVLNRAIAAGGSSLRDHRQTSGELGYFQHSFRVYDREGKPCPGGHGPVRRIVQGGRSTFYCPDCQH